MLTCKHFHRFHKPVHQAEQNHRTPGNFHDELIYYCTAQDEKVQFLPYIFPPSAYIYLNTCDHQCRKQDPDQLDNDVHICSQTISYMMLPPLQQLYLIIININIIISTKRALIVIDYTVSQRIIIYYNWYLTYLLSIIIFIVLAIYESSNFTWFNLSGMNFVFPHGHSGLYN